MNNTFKFALLGILIPFFFSCQPKSETWGEGKYYDDWLFCHYSDTLVMHRTLEIETGDNPFTKNIVFALCEDNLDHDPISTSVFQLLKNGEVCPNNQFVVSPGESVIDLGIKMNRNADSGSHRFVIVARNLGDVECINGEFAELDIPIQLEGSKEVLEVYKNDVMNPLCEGFLIFLGVIIAGFVIALLICRTNNPGFDVRRVYFTDDIAQRAVNCRGASRIICSSTKIKSQNFFSKLFCRRYECVISDVFSSGDVLIEPRSNISTEYGRLNGITIKAFNYDLDTNVLPTGESVVLKNIDTKASIEIRVQ